MADDTAKHTKDLESLVPQRFRVNLSEAEKRLLRAAARGEFADCGPSSDDKDPANDPARADGWGSERQIRAELIRWLCVDPEASRKVDPRGVRVYAAKITDKLDLSFATVLFPLFLYRCRLAGGGYFKGVTMPALSLWGSSVGSLNADSANVRGSVFLSGDFSAVGTVLLTGAQIGGTLECNGGTFSMAGGKALSADRIAVKGSVFLRTGFSAVGEVRLEGAKIGGDLDCSSGTFKNPGKDALAVDSAEIEGDVFLSDGFSADGDVRLKGAQIAGSLRCEGGKFTSLQLDTAAVKGPFFWDNIREPGSTRLSLTNATVGAIADDGPSWPKRGKGKLCLDGFVYRRFTDGERCVATPNGLTTPKDAGTRLDWLDRQEEFTPQPYRQLARVLREMGDDDGAAQVLFEMEKRARAEDRGRIVRAPFRWFRFGEDVVSDAAVGYGIYPMRAIWYLCGLTALGWIVHRRAKRIGAMAPTDKDAYTEFHDSGGRMPARCQPFNPLIYSVENCVPLVKLGQDERWQPDPNPQRLVPPVAAGKVRRFVDSRLDFVVRDWAVSPAALRWFRWIMIGLGWLLATFFVAGLTGIIKVG